MNMEPLPEWLMATAEAAGRTAFTDEFDFGGNERSPLNIAMLSDLLEQQDRMKHLQAGLCRWRSCWYFEIRTRITLAIENPKTVE